ncbi:hypothetical protein N0V84_009735 [Fusarium piperis]|uniref:G domain-containing protein n=1 Tax=Fusarium piperis TaxID=1435070 RepID=A0A9W9BI48_9HYPO|nr:hypothetical protein N0V84_009735 [Fusarium piperis]
MNSTAGDSASTIQSPSILDVVVDDDGRNELGDREIIIAVMGITGAGKSHLIRATTDEPVIVGDGLEACTQRVKGIAMRYQGSNVTFLDTPGFNDTYRSDTDVLYDISSYFGDTYRGGMKLSGIIYLHSIKDNKMRGPSLRSLRMFRKLVGADAMHNVILATTHWDLEIPEVGQRREEELKVKFWKDLIDNGARVVRFMGNQKSGLELLDMLVEKRRVVLDIQREVVDENRNLVDTGAGQVLNQELRKLRQEYEGKLDRAREELVEAIKDKDEKAKIELAKATGEIQSKLEAVEEDSRALRQKGFEQDRKQRELINTLQLMQLASKKEKDGLDKRQEELEKELADVKRQAEADAQANSGPSVGEIMTPLVSCVESLAQAYICHLNQRST